MSDNDDIGLDAQTALLLIQHWMAGALEAAARGNYELCIDRVRIAKNSLDGALDRAAVLEGRRRLEIIDLDRLVLDVVDRRLPHDPL